MTVKELIQKLEMVPENAEVYFEWPIYSDNFESIDGLSYSYDDDHSEVFLYHLEEV